MLKQDSESILHSQLAKARVQAQSYSSQLMQQTDKVSKKCAQIIELEARLTGHLTEIAKLRRPSLWNHLKDFCLNFKANLIAFPQEVPVVRTTGVTEIIWSTRDGSEGQIYVSRDGEPETLFATGLGGSQEAPWIEANSTYEFRLYSGTSHKSLLNNVNVIGVKITAPEARDILRGCLDPVVQDFSDPPYLEVSGWAYSNEAPISWVEVFLDNVPLGLMRYGEPRFDVPSDVSSSISSDCGFSGRFLLDEVLVRPTTLLVRVANEQGNTRDLETVALGPPTIEPVEEDEQDLLLADDPRSFADACIRLYEDSALWNRLRENMLKRVSKNFSPEAFSTQLKVIIE